jgi:hypothetical protein
MDQKKMIMLCMTVGSLTGGYLPSLWNADLFSLSSVLLTAVGGFLGIYIGFQLSN